MIRSVISRIAQGFMIIAIVYAGSFVLMEETAEKTERAESEQEAIQSKWDASKSISLYKTINLKKNQNISISSEFTSPAQRKTSFTNYNINFIYFTSYLDSSYLA